MPSAYEGYGQVLHEAQGCGQVIITTDAPPMNEIQPAILVPSRKATPHHAWLLHAVESKDVACAVRKALSMSANVESVFRDDARSQFEFDRLLFNKALDALVG